MKEKMEQQGIEKKASAGCKEDSQVDQYRAILLETVDPSKIKTNCSGS